MAAAGISWRSLALLALAATLGGCAVDEAARYHSVWRPADGHSTTSTVFYVTDREPDRGWPGGFGKHWSDKASCGSVEASVPAANLPGDPIPTGSIKALTAVACASAAMDGIAGAIAAEARARGCGSVLLFVHGFNTLFSDAILRAAQLAGDTQAGCVAAAFSWSSEGEVARYVADIEHSSYAAPMLESFLRALARTGLRVDVVGHSIGTRLVLSALSALALQPNPPPQNFIGEMILAAADVGADPANNDFVHLLHDALPFVHRTTIYASAGDAVLAISASAHGEVPRAGHRPVSDRRIQTPASERAGAKQIVDVVDATQAPAELLGHSYYGLSYEAVSDIALALHGIPARERLSPAGAWGATLVCKTREGQACNRELPLYALNVSDDRRPTWSVRLIRRLVPLIPRVELAPFTSGAE